MILGIYTLLVVLILFGLTIFVHELGHFLVARRFGMKVDAFAIGFGPAIWSTKRNGVLYKVGLIPFGGYVALPQMDPEGAEATADGHIPEIAPWKKIPVAVAGAVGNIILAFIIAWIISIIGKPSAPHERDTVVGYVVTEGEEEERLAYEQGLRIGHRIVAVNGTPVSNWQDINVEATLSREVVLDVDTSEEMITVTLPTWDTEMGVRLLPGVSWVGHSDVAQVVPDSPAERAGLRPGDRILAFNEVKLYSTAQLIGLVDEHRDRLVPVKVERRGESMTIDVQPEYDPEEDRALIGIIFSPPLWTVDYDEVIHPKPWEMIREFSTLIFRVLRALATPSQAGMAASALAGPVYILYALWDMVQNSFAMALWFTCLLNVNLAILNLLPIPVLDGGHIVFSLWEVITRRRINARFKVIIMGACWFLLIFAMIYLSFRDVSRLGLMSRSAPTEEVEPAPDDAKDGPSPAAQD